MTDASLNESGREPVRPATGVSSSKSERRWSGERLLSLGALFAFGAYFASLAYRYRDMFLLIEYRQWAFHAPQTLLLTSRPFSDLFNPIADPGQFNAAFSRSTSFWLADLFGDVCGTTPSCHNGLHLAMLVGATALLMLSTRALSVSGSWFPAVATGVVVALSVPVLDAITWQATFLDKTAMLLTAITILVASRIGVGRRRPWPLAVINLALLVPIFFAYNAKEQVLFLAPATLLLLFFRSMMAGATFVGAVRRALSLFGLPLAYACLHVAIVYYNRTFLQPGEMSRVTGGNVAFNVEFYTRYIFNMFGGRWTVRDLEWTALGIGALVLAGIVVDLCRTARRHVPLTLFPLLALVGSLYITLRTSSTSPFYLLVSMAYFGLLVGLSLDSVLASLPSAPLRLAFACICSAALAARAVTLGDALPEFDHLHRMSSNFRKTLDEVRIEAARAPFGRIVFVRPPDEPRSYMFVSAPADAGDYALAPYLASPHATMTDLMALDARIKDIPADKATSEERPGDLVVFLTDKLAIDRSERVP